MRTRRTFQVVFVLVLIPGLIAWTAAKRQEPIIHGHSLTYWLASWEQDEKWRTADPEVFNEMDDVCVKFLISRLDWKPSEFIRKLDYIPSDLFGTEPFHDHPDYRAISAAVLGRLGSRASPAIPFLEKLAHQTNRWETETGTTTRGSVIAALIMIRQEPVEPSIQKLLNYSDCSANDYRSAIYYLGTNAAPSIPLLIKTLESNPDETVAFRAAWALADIHSQAEISVPAIASLLTSTNDQLREVAVICLKSFGADARLARSALVPCLNDPSATVRDRTANLLRLIDSKAGDRVVMK